MSESQSKEFETRSVADPQQEVETSSRPMATPPGSPDTFREMAHNVNPVSGAYSTGADLTQAFEPQAVGTPAASQRQSFDRSALQAAIARALEPFRNFPNWLLQTLSQNVWLVPLLVVLLLGMPLVLLMVSTLSVIDSVPLLPTFLELVGLGYTTWFVYRYLLFAGDRRELWHQMQQFWAKVSQPSTTPAATPEAESGS